MNKLNLNELHLLTVKILTTGGQHLGTGFFLSPTVIVTCCHIIRNRDLQELVFIRGGSAKITPVAILKGVEDPYDFALFEIPPSAEAPSSFVALNNDIRPFDQLISYGYSDEFPGGATVTMESEGLTGDTPPLIKFKSGRIRPGLSGSPVFNLRTGQICGMIKFTLNRSIEIGGGAVTAATILENYLIKSDQNTHYTKVGQADDYEGLFQNTDLIYVDTIDTLEKSDDVWRWIQRVFKHRHPLAYEEFDLVDQELDRTWWAKNHDIDWSIRDWTHEQIGQYTLCPITEKVFYQLSEGSKIESQITADDILSPGETQFHRFWYLSNFMKTRVKPKIPREVGIYVEKLMMLHFYYRALNSEQFSTNKKGEIVIIAFAEAHSIKQFVERNRYTKIFPHTKDKELEKLYSSIWSYPLLKRLYRDVYKELEQLKQTVIQYADREVFQQPPNY